jgi:FecR protein
MVRRLLLLALLAVLLGALTAGSSRAQDTDAVAPAHVAFVEGTVTLERDGRPDTAPLNMPLLSGDRLRTADGRVEVLFGDGSALYLDARTTVDFQSDELLRLIDGRVRMNIIGPAESVSYRIDSPAGSVRMMQPGEYRVAMLHGDRDVQLELAVVRGNGEIFTDQGTTPVRSGERAYASAGLAPSLVYAFNSASLDDFDRWSEMRQDVRVGASAQYLPPEVQTYAPVLDQYGDWRYNQPYGYVWYPRVSVGWRPYYYGRWISYPSYGWTWVGLDRFGWPTHHYGRWGFAAGSWFWVPGPRYSPAWVSWAYAPGYVSWCPLGSDNRPIVAINVNVGFGPRYYSPWNAWTVVATPHFGYGYVHQRVIHVDRVFDARSQPVFVSRASAPAVREVATARASAAPIRWTGASSTRSQGFASSSRVAQPSNAGAPARDNYFTRDSVRGEHAVDRASGAPLPAPSRAPREGSATRSGNGGSGSGASAPRAVPRGGVSESRAPIMQNRSNAPAITGGNVRGAAPDVAVRRVRPGTSTAAPREWGGRDQSTYRTQPAPSYRVTPSPSRAMPPPSAVTRGPRDADRSIAPAPVMRESIPRGRPQVEYAPREYARPSYSAPKVEAAPPRAYEPRAAEPRREASPPPERSAPSERAAPRESSKSAPSRSAPPPRRERG